MTYGISHMHHGTIVQYIHTYILYVTCVQYICTVCGYIMDSLPKHYSRSFNSFGNHSNKQPPTLDSSPSYTGPINMQLYTHTMYVPYSIKVAKIRFIRIYIVCRFEKLHTFKVHTTVYTLDHTPCSADLN